jgi:2-polyprenyl-6-methoxyphenol hydroxylase-like FAD-dependent oxidoreductase
MALGDRHEHIMMRTALVVGAGIGGLSAALALRRSGWDVRVFEQAESPRELGFGVGIAPNAVAALRELGVGDTVVAHGFEPRRGELRRVNGSVLKRAELPPNALGGPMLVALRPALHGALLEAVGLDAITLGTRATGFTESGGRIALQLNGRIVAGDLLVGADGVHSVLRQQLHPTEPAPRTSGIVAVRGAVHGALRHLGRLHAVYYLGPGVESMFVRASNTGIYWFLSLSERVVPPSIRQDPAAIVAAMAPKFDDTFRAITSVTDDMRVDELVDRNPLPSWGRGVVTLLGDAAHPLLPHTGQGAAQAIVDAVALARSLTHTSEVDAALRAYERERIPKTAALVAQGRRTARVMASTSPILNTARELFARSIPMTTFARLFVRINRRAGTDVRPH